MMHQAQIRKWTSSAVPFMVGGLFALLVFDLGLRGAFGQQTDPCITKATFSDEMFDDLATMNNKLDKLINDYDKLTREERRKRFVEIIKLKRTMVQQRFPEVFGLRFFDLYIRLYKIDINIDSSADEAKDDFKEARNQKEALEQLLIESPCYTPASPSPSASPSGSKPQGGPMGATLSPPNTTYAVSFSDPDGDVLTYDWSETSVSCGTFTAGTANSTDSIPDNQAVWSHPNGTETGTCPHEGTSHTGTIVVKVSDGHGNVVRCTYSGSESGQGPPCE